MEPNPRIGPIERATGVGWDEWLEFMASIDAPALTHHEIATKTLKRIAGDLDNPAWWAQSIAVAYQQSIGRRVPGQRPDGTFQTSVSRATPLSMHDLIVAWTSFSESDQPVLDEITTQPKVGGTDRRLTWRAKADGGITINVLCEPKPNGTASFIVQHIGSSTAEDNERAKARWVEIASRFVESLET